DEARLLGGGRVARGRGAAQGSLDERGKRRIQVALRASFGHRPLSIATPPRVIWEAAARCQASGRPRGATRPGAGLARADRGANAARGTYTSLTMIWQVVIILALGTIEC